MKRRTSRNMIVYVSDHGYWWSLSAPAAWDLLAAVGDHRNINFSRFGVKLGRKPAAVSRPKDDGRPFRGSAGPWACAMPHMVLHNPSEWTADCPRLRDAIAKVRAVVYPGGVAA